ncbi:DUF4142 domain-containing protein [Fulvimonas sp. R45]|uniref:DUF4142 domain-containing protein n=1 Tax=Fulvimonas sp. R45 TaxID=3045937 RepID=UPI00265F9432|nr:DUF4142 domain-containing protein [Fulvimonas sp. R45]MDO1527238.1 DUF4142 domain-containing protein [Fulvimonas sp. R45]
MRKHLLLITLLSAGALALACQATAQRRADTGSGNAARTGASLTGQDRSFLRDASASGAAEVSLGQLALQQSSAPQVHELAQRIVDDHTRANRQLAELATRDDVAVSAQPQPDSVAEAQKLRALHGPAFDRAFADAMVRDHRKAIALFEGAAGSGNAQISQFAKATLPALRQHLQMAQALAQGSHSMQSSGQGQLPQQPMQQPMQPQEPTPPGGTQPQGH